MKNITTERLILRSWQEGDAADLYVLARDADVGPRAGWEPHESVGASLKIIRTILSAPEVYAITDRETGELMGSLGLHPSRDKKEGEWELGYWIGKPYWGRGYVPEAAKAALHRAFTELGCSAVWCSHFEGNDQSRRVIEKCGFTRLPEMDREDSSYADGKVHQLRVYRMTAEEWSAIYG